jgi:hypothetical protein
LFSDKQGIVYNPGPDSKSFVILVWRLEREVVVNGAGGKRAESFLSGYCLQETMQRKLVSSSQPAVRGGH